MLNDKKKAQMDRLKEAMDKTFKVVYNSPGMNDDPADCKNHPDQCRKDR